MSPRSRQRVALSVVVALVAAMIPAAPTAFAAEVGIQTIGTADLRAVSFASSTVGVAVASDGKIYRTADGGATWPLTDTEAGFDFRGVDFWNANNGVAVDAAGKVATTSNGGATWTAVNFSPYADMDRDAILAHGKVGIVPGTGYLEAVAAAGDDNPADDSLRGGVPLRTNGTFEFWGIANNLELKPHIYDNDMSDPAPEGEALLLDVDFANATVGITVGEDYYLLNPDNPAKFPVYTTSDGGGTWTERSMPLATDNYRLEGVAMGSTTQAVTVGGLVGGTGRAFYSTNAGASWSAASLPGTAWLYAVDMKDATTGWAVGASGTVLRTTDGGVSWSACNVPMGFTSTLYDVEYVAGTDNTAVAVGASGAAIRTTDGLNWEALLDTTSPPPTVVYTPLEGSDRYLTAIEVSKSTFPSGASAVMIATGYNFPDALASAGLAGVVQAPVLLVHGAEKTLARDGATKAEIDRVLAGQSVRTIFIAGGTVAVSSGLESALRAAYPGVSIVRFPGADRYDTARLIAQRMKSEMASRAIPWSGDAFVVPGLDFRDALIVGPESYAAHMPILLYDPRGMGGLQTTIGSLGVTEVFVSGASSGSTGYVPTGLNYGAGVAEQRISTSTSPYTRSVQVATWAGPALGVGYTRVGIATGELYPDGLAAAPRQGTDASVLLLTPSKSLDSSVASALSAHDAQIAEVRYFGGPVALTQSVRDAVDALLH